MQINTDNFSTIRAAEYDESTDMLRMVIICCLEDIHIDLDVPPTPDIIRDLDTLDDILRGAVR